MNIQAIQAVAEINKSVELGILTPQIANAVLLQALLNLNVSTSNTSDNKQQQETTEKDNKQETKSKKNSS